MFLPRGCNGSIAVPYTTPNYFPRNRKILQHTIKGYKKVRLHIQEAKCFMSGRHAKMEILSPHYFADSKPDWKILFRRLRQNFTESERNE